MIYLPSPIDTSKTVVDDEIYSMIELLAKNTHEVWAKQRICDGWSYGPIRSDLKRLTPCLLPYEHLSESEKEYDRKSIEETMKVIIELGYKIVKVETK